MPPVPQDQSSSPIDFERLNQVAEGDRTFESQVLNVFLVDIGQRIELLARAASAEHFSTLILESHNVKGASRNMGAHPLRLAAERCEAAAREGNAANAAAAIALMRGELERVRVTVQERLR
jgi:HPt (histidine-containing phosphotransfer) domain-containing protein